MIYTPVRRLCHCHTRTASWNKERKETEKKNNTFFTPQVARKFHTESAEPGALRTVHIGKRSNCVCFFPLATRGRSLLASRPRKRIVPPLKSLPQRQKISVTSFFRRPNGLRRKGVHTRVSQSNGVEWWAQRVTRTIFRGSTFLLRYSFFSFVSFIYLFISFSKKG